MAHLRKHSAYEKKVLLHLSLYSIFCPNFVWFFEHDSMPDQMTSDTSSEHNKVPPCKAKSSTKISRITSRGWLLLLNNKQVQVKSNQCDQIWRNFTTLAKVYKFFAFFDGSVLIWQNAEPTYFGKFVTLLGKFSLLQMAKQRKII